MPIEVAVQVFRYKPGLGPPRYQDFRVTVPDAANIIDVIEACWLQDRTLMFRHACHHASCGTCAVRLNGYEKLPCIVPVVEAMQERRELLIEPLRNLPVIGDLVVDVNGFFDRQAGSGMGITRYAEPALNGAAYSPGEVFDENSQLEPLPYNRFENCIECGICISACPTMAAADRFIGPAGLSAIHRARLKAADPKRKTQLLALADGEQGVWRCHSAYECTEACPQNVDPAGAIMALRRDLMTQRIKRLFGANGA
jgi:succinate dehydrogenase / fumarate reductase iron-sulfur subunit